MAITNTTLTQNASLVTETGASGYVADKTVATLPSTSLSITTNMLLGAIAGAIVVKLLD